MKKTAKILALALGSVLALSVFAACGKGENADAAETYRICYDNLGANYLNAADTQFAASNAKNIKGYDKNGKEVDYKTVATYANGVFTAVGEGKVVFSGGGTQYTLEVVPAYVTDPGNQYSGTYSFDAKLDPIDDFNDTGKKLLGNTHDPSFIEVERDGRTEYYLFSTGWAVGNDVHVSYDGMLKWDYVGKTTQSTDWGDESVFPQELVEWMNASNNDNDIQWWAPDIVEAKGGGYWFYTCLVMADNRMPNLTSTDTSIATSTKYSRACCVMYYIKDLDDVLSQKAGALEYKGVLMQSAIPQNAEGGIDINGIDPQIIYDTEGNMYMSYGSFGTGNWLIELDPETGLRKDGRNGFYDWMQIRKWRNEVVSGEENNKGSSSLPQTYVYKQVIKEDGTIGTYTHDYYGRIISLGAMEAPIIARHDNVVIADENAEYDSAGNAVGTGKTYYYSMHSYNGLANDYQMWGGRSESVWGTYLSTGGGVVYNINYGQSGNQGNKYMGGFAWQASSKANNSKEYDACLTGHNDLYTTKNGISVAAYINRNYAATGQFLVQVHQYYLNSMGDICISPNRYSGEIDRGVSKEELLALTDGGKFEMAVLTNAKDWTASGVSNVSRTVVFKEDGTIEENGTKIGSYLIYGKGYIKLTFDAALKGYGNNSSNETVYYGVVRPSWLGNRNQSGFTITALGNTEGNKQSMPLFFNNYSTITGTNLVGE